MKTTFLLFILLTLLIACKQKDVHGMHEHASDVYYTCSMDPQVMQHKPGKCPICHMDLTPVSAAQLHSKGISLSDQQILLGNIKTQPVHTSSSGEQVYVTGLVKTNEENIQWINSRLDGRIDQLFIKTNGEKINKGQVLYKIYSEVLLAAQTEYIQNQKVLQQEPDNKLLVSIQKSIETKLLLWGIMPSQIETLKTLSTAPVPYPILSSSTGYITAVASSEGTRVMEGGNMFELAGYNSLWIDAQVYAEDLYYIDNSTGVTVSIEGVATDIQGKVVQILPQVAPSSLIHIVRIVINNPMGIIQPGMQANIIIRRNNKETAITIPSDAVLRSSEGNIVWVKTKKGIFESRMVETGIMNKSNIVILNGLQEGDEIVVSGAYLLENEYIFKKGMNTMEGHEM